jgi:hypothetical protein
LRMMLTAAAGCHCCSWLLLLNYARD